LPSRPATSKAFFCRAKENVIDAGTAAAQFTKLPASSLQKHSLVFGFLHPCSEYFIRINAASSVYWFVDLHEKQGTPLGLAGAPGYSSPDAGNSHLHEKQGTKPPDRFRRTRKKPVLVPFYIQLDEVEPLDIRIAEYLVVQEINLCCDAGKALVAGVDGDCRISSLGAVAKVFAQADLNFCFRAVLNL
jgi:hypothetical protein